MTTADPWLNPALLEPERPGWLRRAGAAVARFASSSRRKALVTGAKALVATIRGRFTLAQLAGGSSASAGVFVLWGLGVGLLATGLAVLVASTVLERQT